MSIVTNHSLWRKQSLTNLSKNDVLTCFLAVLYTLVKLINGGAIILKKIATLIVTLALLLPFTATLPTPVAAAKTKTYKFLIINANFLNAKQTFHTAKSSVTVYKAAFGADNPSMDLTANGKLKPASTYYVTKIIKAKSDTTRKNQTFSYVQGHGWVQQAKLVRGVFD